MGLGFINNPINTDIQLFGNYEGSIHIVDIAGREIYSDSVHSNGTIKLALGSGIYFLRDEQGNSTKFVIN